MVTQERSKLLNTSTVTLRQLYKGIIKSSPTYFPELTHEKLFNHLTTDDKHIRFLLKIASKLNWPIDELTKDWEGYSNPFAWNIAHLLPKWWFAFDTVKDLGYQLAYSLDNTILLPPAINQYQKLKGIVYNPETDNVLLVDRIAIRNSWDKLPEDIKEVIYLYSDGFDLNIWTME